MSKSKPVRTDYAALVKELRKVASGFDADSGYDLRKPLTKARKVRINKYAREVAALTSRENYLFRPRNKNNLKMAQRVAQHDAGFPALKVAFIPWTKPQGARDAKPEIKFRKKGLVIETSNYRKQFIPFDLEKLADDSELEIITADDVRLIDGLEKITRTDIQTVTDLEIARVLYQAPDNATFMIQTGKYQIANPYDAAHITGEVKKLMERYDGKNQIRGTRTGREGTLKWRAEDHDYRQWLNGIIAYTFKPGGAGNNAPRLGEAMKLNQQRLKKEKHEREKARRAQARREDKWRKLRQGK